MHNTVRWNARRSYVVLAFILIIIVLVLAGCTGLNREAKAHVSPGTVEHVARGGDDNDSGSITRGAILDAVIGGAAGSIIGRQMDQQAREIEQRVSGATVDRIGEGIRLTFASALLYDANAEQLSPAGEQTLRNLATTFDRYRDTDLLIVGHSDSAGRYDQARSQRRARSVSDFLLSQGVPVGRLHSAGQGETKPLDSDVADGARRPTRGVEVAIFASASYRSELTRQR